jgi:hypothetical protein
MASLKQKGLALLGSATIDMKTAATTTIFTAPTLSGTQKVRVMFVVFHSPTASLAGGTSYSLTGFVQTFSLATLTAATGYAAIGPIFQITTTAPTQYTELASGANFQLTVTTGSTLAANATIEVWGYIA